MSSSGTLLFLGVVGIAIAAFATKPSPGDIEDKVKDFVVSELQEKSVGGSDNLFGDLALIGCKLDVNQCYDLIRQTISIKYQDNIVYADVTISTPAAKLNCVGVFNQMYCPGFLNE